MEIDLSALVAAQPLTRRSLVGAVSRNSVGGAASTAQLLGALSAPTLPPTMPKLPPGSPQSKRRLESVSRAARFASRAKLAPKAKMEAQSFETYVGVKELHALMQCFFVWPKGTGPTAAAAAAAATGSNAAGGAIHADKAPPQQRSGLHAVAAAAMPLHNFSISSTTGGGATLAPETSVGSAAGGQQSEVPRVTPPGTPREKTKPQGLAALVPLVGMGVRGGGGDEGSAAAAASPAGAKGAPSDGEDGGGSDDDSDRASTVSLETLALEGARHVSLTETAFIDAVCRVLPQNGRDEVRLWFQRIDCDATGTVSWEEFSSFLLSHGQKRHGSDQRAFEYASRAAPTSCPAYHQHNDLISCVAVHPRSGRVFTGSRDGTIRLWEGDPLRHVRLVFNGSAWITGLVLMRNEKRVVASTIDRRLMTFDAKSGELLRSFVGRPVPPTDEGLRYAMESVETIELGHTTAGYAAPKDIRASSMNRALPQKGANAGEAGDGGGGGSAVNNKLRTLSFEEFRGLMEVERLRHAENKKYDQCVLAGLDEAPTALEYFPTPSGEDSVFLGTRSGALVWYVLPTSLTKVVPMQRHTVIHDDAVNQIKYAAHISALLTCSDDCSVRIVAIDTGLVVRVLSRLGHERGVHCMAYSESLKLIASCGAERTVLIWNHLQDTPVFRLDDHGGPLIGLAINEEDGQIITASADQTIKVYDIRTLRCVQTLQEKRPKDLPIVGILYDPSKQRILCNTYFPVQYQLRKRVGIFPPNYVGHTIAVHGTLFSSAYQQLLTFDNDCLIVWGPDSGECGLSFPLASFQSSHDEFRLTAVALDGSKRRLLTGFQKGVVVVWNFMNGQPLNVIRDAHVQSHDEVLAVVVVTRMGRKFFVSSVGWRLLVAEEAENQFTITNVASWPVPADCGQIIAMEAVSPYLVACGSTSGAVLLFHVMNQIQDGHTLWVSQHESPPASLRGGNIATPIVTSLLGNSLAAGGSINNGGVVGSGGGLSNSSHHIVAKVDKLIVLAAPHTDFLVAVHGDGRIVLWNTVKRLCHDSHYLVTPAGSLATNVTIDEVHNDIMAHSDELGNVAVWRFACTVGAGSNPVPSLAGCELRYQWGAHQKTITSVLVLRAVTPCIVTSSIDCSCRLFTLQGACVGHYGVGTWSLGRSEGWVSTVPSPPTVPLGVASSGVDNEKLIEETLQRREPRAARGTPRAVPPKSPLPTARVPLPESGGDGSESPLGGGAVGGGGATGPLGGQVGTASSGGVPSTGGLSPPPSSGVLLTPRGRVPMAPALGLGRLLVSAGGGSGGGLQLDPAPRSPRPAAGLNNQRSPQSPGGGASVGSQQQQQRLSPPVSPTAWRSPPPLRSTNQRCSRARAAGLLKPHAPSGLVPLAPSGSNSSYQLGVAHGGGAPRRGRVPAGASQGASRPPGTAPSGLPLGSGRRWTGLPVAIASEEGPSELPVLVPATAMPLQRFSSLSRVASLQGDVDLNGSRNSGLPGMSAESAMASSLAHTGSLVAAAAAAAAAASVTAGAAPFPTTRMELASSIRNQQQSSLVLPDGTDSQQQQSRPLTRAQESIRRGTLQPLQFTVSAPLSSSGAAGIDEAGSAVVAVEGRDGAGDEVAVEQPAAARMAAPLEASSSVVVPLSGAALAVSVLLAPTRKFTLSPATPLRVGVNPNTVSISQNPSHDVSTTSSIDPAPVSNRTLNVSAAPPSGVNVTAISNANRLGVEGSLNPLPNANATISGIPVIETVDERRDRVLAAHLSAHRERLRGCCETFADDMRRLERRMGRTAGGAPTTGGGGPNGAGVSPGRHGGSRKDGQDDWTDRVATLLACEPPRSSTFLGVSRSGGGGGSIGGPDGGLRGSHQVSIFSYSPVKHGSRGRAGTDAAPGGGPQTARPYTSGRR